MSTEDKELLTVYRVQRSNYDEVILENIKLKGFTNLVTVYTYNATFSVQNFPRTCIRDTIFIVNKHKELCYGPLGLSRNEFIPALQLEPRVFKVGCESGEFLIIGDVPLANCSWERHDLALAIPVAFSGGAIIIILVLSVYFTRRVKQMRQQVQLRSAIHDIISTSPIPDLEQRNSIGFKGKILKVSRSSTPNNSTTVTGFYAVGNESEERVVNYLSVINTDNENFELNIYIRRCFNMNFNDLNDYIKNEYKRKEADEMSFFVCNRAESFKRYPFLLISLDTNGGVTYSSFSSIITVYRGVVGYLVNVDNSIDFRPESITRNRAAFFDFPGKETELDDEDTYIELEDKGEGRVFNED